jgi:lipoyl(octanoyl) transferase
MPLFGELDVFFDTTPHSAATNMAIDEAILEHVRIPTVRFYRWDHPALSLGYFGKFADIEQYAGPRDLVRRWTGGGIVFHGEDLTYSISIPSSTEGLTNSSRAIYAAVHEALRKAIEENGHPAELATSESERVSDSCFANPVTADVVSGNQKIAGAAHRRTRAGLLHQGSIQNMDISNDLASAFAKHLCPHFRDAALNSSLIDRAHQIAETKYATEAWLRRW